MTQDEWEKELSRISNIANQAFEPLVGVLDKVAPRSGEDQLYVITYIAAGMAAVSGCPRDAFLKGAAAMFDLLSKVAEQDGNTLEQRLVVAPETQEKS